MKALEVTNQASRILFDNTQVRWTANELFDYVTEGQRNIVQIRADAYPVTRVHALVKGTRQTIDGIYTAGTVNTSTGVVSGHVPAPMRLLRVHRNMGAAATGTPPTQATATGTLRAIRTIGRETLDNEQPDWHSSAAAVVEHYLHDNIDPNAFYVYPGVQAAPSGQSYFVELTYSAIPRTVEHEQQILALSDQYLGVLLDWVLYRAYSKDSAYGGNMQRAGVHLSNFASALGTTVKNEWAAATPPDKTAPSPRTPDAGRSA